MYAEFFVAQTAFDSNPLFAEGQVLPPPFADQIAYQ